jgi:hypothetical protein
MPRKANHKGQKQCPKCEKWVKGTKTKTCPHCGHEFFAAKPEAPSAEPVAVAAALEAPVKAGNAITLAQIRAVGNMVKTLGGFKRLHEMLSVIREVGGPKKFKDLLDAMALSEGEGQS